MIHEKDFEDIICKYPDLIEDGLTFKGRQITLYGRRMDILFEDKFKRKLIIELKVGPIKDAHIGQILSYEGMLLSDDDPTIRVMLVGNRVPPNIQRSLDHHGIAWQEITFTHLKIFLEEKHDDDFLSMMNNDDTSIPSVREVKAEIYKPVYKTKDEIIAALKASELYSCFKSILDQKIKNEERARSILIENMGNLTFENLKQIKTLVDEPYPYTYKGKTVNTPWFGRLLQSNTKNLFAEDIIKINNWFNTLSNNSIPVERRLEILLKEPYNISGLNVGFMTLMLYILNKNEYQIWFQGLHDGFKLIDNEFETYTGRSKQYKLFNEAVKKFALQYSFEHTELDWIFSTGIPAIAIGKGERNISKEKNLQKSGLGEIQMEYWQALKNYMETRRSFVKIRDARPQSWSDISIGKSDIYISASINAQTQFLNIWLMIRGDNAKKWFDILFKSFYEASLIEIDKDVFWDRREGTKGCVVLLRKTAGFQNIKEWDQQFAWFKDNLEKYVRFFKPIIKDLE